MGLASLQAGTVCIDWEGGMVLFSLAMFNFWGLQGIERGLQLEKFFKGAILKFWYLH